MKKNLSVLLFLFVGITTLFQPIHSYAGFLIELKNGRTIYAENYQMEGNQIILYLESGTIKFEKDEIKSITQSKMPIEEIEKKEEKISPKKPDEKLWEKETSIGKEDIEQYKNKKKEIQKRLEEAKKVYFEASGKDEKDKARNSMLSVSKELFELQREVTEKNSGVVPKWWQEE